MLFSKFTAWALLAVTSIALPSPQAIEVKAPDVSSIETRAIPDKFYQHAVKAIKAFGPGSTKTMMHSHIGPAKAFQVAKKKELQTVETTIFKAVMADKDKEYKDTLKKYCVTKEDFCKSDEKKEKDWVEAWEAVSKAWAKYAEENTVLATDKNGPDEESFFKRIEEPILKENEVKVTVDDSH